MSVAPSGTTFFNTTLSVKAAFLHEYFFVVHSSEVTVRKVDRVLPQGKSFAKDIIKKLKNSRGYIFASDLPSKETIGQIKDVSNEENM